MAESDSKQTWIYNILAVVGAIWSVFLLDWILPVRLTEYGLTPRSLTGILGIVTMPFLHADLRHLISNTVPLIVLLALLIGSRSRPWEVVIEVVLAGGVLLWLFGRHATHVGASGLIFGLIGFLIVSGFCQRRFVPIVVALIVGFLYGGSLITGVLPRFGSEISWDGHLWGAIGGGGVAWLLERRERNSRLS